jgi:glucosamine--fructose-6-phosphate aminotransferase (isomerizing)
MSGALPDRYLEEIRGQPAAMRRAAAALERQASALRQLAALADRRPILLTGMGSSLDACLAAAATLGATGILATPIEAAELVHLRPRLLTGGGILVVVSQSGASAEIMRLAEAVHTLPRRPYLVAVTNGARTLLGARADIVLDTEVGPETSPSSMTFAGSLVALGAIAGVLGGAGGGGGAGGPGPGAAARVAAILDQMTITTEAAARAAEQLLVTNWTIGDRLLAWLGSRRTIVALGRGTGLAAAEMSALTLEEAAGLAALALPTAEFRHGPIEIAGPDVAVILFALEPATAALDRAFAGELAGAGAAVVLVGPAGAVETGVESIAVGGPPGILAPALAVIPIQLLARRLARARGRHPGELTRASKVTTRE